MLQCFEVYIVLYLNKMSVMQHELQLHSEVVVHKGLKSRHKATLTETIPYLGICLHSFREYVLNAYHIPVLFKVLRIQT